MHSLIRKTVCNLIGFVFVITSVSTAAAHSTANDHAPIGVMGDHLHKQGEWMVSYRYMRMDMDETYVGEDEVDTSRVLSEFMVAPLSMTMDMHMVGGMYGLTDDITIMLMIPYVEKDMDHRTRMGGMFSTSSSGIGDIKLSGLFSVYQDETQRVHLNFGVSFPSGSIDERDRTPMGPNQLLPYPMQLGSGTYDLHPGITYTGQHERLSWGTQFTAVQRLGENDRDYTLGNRYEASTWIAYEPADWVSGSFRLRKKYWGDIDGADPDLNPNMVQTADPTRQAGRQLDALFGLNLIGTGDNWLHGHRLALEVGFPIDVDVNGPQLISDLEFTVGWQKAW
ncbi:MAG: hypothetical protein KC900_08940 [Candidatus Omnitrophica bacterium]|nr:hypothetical protein [Candidatus Omnitrophota bacterium]